MSTKGYFYGFNSIVMIVILLQAVGGLVVAVVVKYADNIVKGFAASFSIITSCILTIMFFGFRPNETFLIGAVSLICLWPVMGVHHHITNYQRHQSLSLIDV